MESKKKEKKKLIQACLTLSTGEQSCHVEVSTLM